MEKILKIIGVALLAVGLASGAFAAGTSGDSDKSDSNKSDKKDYDSSKGGDKAAEQYNHAVKMLESNNYKKAEKALKKAVRYEKGNADYWNLLGFSLRKQEKFNKAKNAYDKALRIDKNHLGANEYLGELYIQTDQPDRARAQLARLQELCPNGCEELTMFEKALK